MSPFPLAPRVRSLQPSPTVAVSDQARKLKAQGIDVVDLGGGDPDFPTPQHICDVAKQALDAGRTHYVEVSGIRQLRHAIASKLKSDNGVDVDPDGGVLVTAGGKASLYEAMQAIVGPGDDVMLLDPSWPSFGPMIQLAGGTPVRVPLRPEEHYAITPELLARHVTPKTRAILVNTPNNPTGRVATRSELDAVARFATERDLLVLSDEIYEKILYDGHRHHSLASLPGMAARTLTFNGFSKAYAMTGWRLGYVAGPVELVQAIAKIHSHSATCVPEFAQLAAVVALEGPQEFIRTMVETWDRRRKRVVDAVQAIPHVTCATPEGAFYALIDVRGLGATSAVVAEKLLEKAHVAMTPGSAFGSNGEGFLRLAYSAADSALETGLARTAELLGGWKRP